MRLHILRHGKTNPTSKTGKDFDRELLPKGIKQCEALKAYLNRLNIATVWCSSAARTTETAALVLNENHPTPKYSDDFYLASKQSILQKIWSQQSSEDVLIIGHNFGISDVATYFTDQPVELRTGEYICIKFDCDSWNETSMGLGIILDRYRPKVSL
jgi:phosphohistidine phosphatase